MGKADFIAQDLLSKIYQHQYASGKLPTERELASTYGSSRDTIQHALKTLRAIGVIETVQGSGIYLRDQGRINPLVFNSVTLASYSHLTSRCLGLTCAPATPQEQRVFQMPGPLPVWDIRRMRMVDHRSVQIEHSHMPVTMFPNLTPSVVEQSIQEHVESTGNRISHFMTVYAPVHLSGRQARMLGCKRSEPAMHIRTRGILSNGRVFEYSDVIAIEYTVSYIRPFDREIHRTRMGEAH